MKNLISTSILAVLIASMTTVRAQNYPEEYLGLPGDNLNLYAVMKLFQESETLEAFERNLNAEDSHINNLDLNGDNLVDYITVTDYVDKNVHTIVLRTALNRKENQDIAVFTVQKFSNGSAQIQLIGDEALYGRNYIVEPIYAETPNPGYKGRTVYRDNVTVVTTTYYEVAAWPVIRFIYDPFYICWRSPWYWGYNLAYWHPWRPFYWHYYYGYHYNWYPEYYAHYHHYDHYRYSHYNDHYYHGMRQYSPEVAHRINEGHYKETYSRPEMKREGEAMYARTNGSKSGNSHASASVQGSARRTAAPVSARTTNGTSGNNSEVTQRSASTVNSRSESSPQAGQSSAAGRRASAATSGRSVSNSAEVKNAPSAQRTTTASAQRSASSRQATVQKSAPSASGQQSSAQRSQPSASRKQSSVQKSQPSASKQQSSVQRSQPSASRQQSSVQRSQPAAPKQQSSVNRSQPSSSSSRSSMQASSANGRTDRPAPAAASSRSSNAGKSTGNTSQKSSSPNKSDDNRPSRR